jgi:hypothetical protein
MRKRMGYFFVVIVGLVWGIAFSSASIFFIAGANFYKWFTL